MATRSTPPIDEVKESYLRSKRRAWPSEGTRRAHAERLNRFCRFVQEDGKRPKQIGRLEQRQLREFMDLFGAGDRRVGGTGVEVGASAYNGMRSSLGMFLRYVYRYGYLDCGTWMDEFEKAKDDTPIRKKLQIPSDVMREFHRRLPEFCDHPRDRAMNYFSMHTGLRAQEISHMVVGDVDFDRGMFYVVIPKSHVDDWFPMTDELLEEMRLWRETYPTLSKTGDMPKDGLLFPKKEAGPWSKGPREWLMTAPIDPYKAMNHEEQVIKRAMRKSGWWTEGQLKGQGFHAMRRSFALHSFMMMTKSEGVARDMALRMVSAALHHKDTRTTEIYLGLEHSREARDDFYKGRRLYGSEPAAPTVRHLHAV